MAKEFICFLAEKEASLADFCKVTPALTFLHHSQGHSSEPTVKDSYVQLLLSGGKREAAARKSRPKKATCLSKPEIYRIVTGLWPGGINVLDPAVDLISWRTTVKIYTMYRSWCWWDGYSRLTSEDIIIEDDSVTISFVRAKNDQYYSGTSCLLPILGHNNVMCPKLIYETYFQVMNFTKSPGELLNCRIANRDGIQKAKPQEKLSYTTSMENSKSLLGKFGLQGMYSEKSFKVAGVSEAFNQGISVEDAMFHGRWRSLETPGIYCHQSKKKRLDISNYTTS